MGRTIGGFGEPGRGFWGIRLNADDNPLDRDLDRETDVRAALLRQIDHFVNVEGIERGAAVRYVEDLNHFKRGTLLRFLQS